jgi:two-component system, LuxR family, response regulator FixJ
MLLHDWGRSRTPCMTRKDGLVHVVDDDDAVRESVTFLLESAGLEARTYVSANAFLAAFPHDAHGCVVTDVRMPGVSGIELLRLLKTMRVALPVVVITGQADVPLAVEAMKCGAIDFIEKPFDGEHLLSTIRSALRPRDDDARRKAQRSEIHVRLDALSGRERQVLEGLVAGCQNKMIADDLGISAGTVEIYRANVMTKMQATSLSDIVRMAFVAGLLQPINEPPS